MCSWKIAELREGSLCGWRSGEQLWRMQLNAVETTLIGVIEESFSTERLHPANIDDRHHWHNFWVQCNTNLMEDTETNTEWMSERIEPQNVLLFVKKSLFCLSLYLVVDVLQRYGNLSWIAVGNGSIVYFGSGVDYFCEGLELASGCRILSPSLDSNSRSPVEKS